jgi:hypothetical protein
MKSFEGGFGTTHEAEESFESTIENEYSSLLKGRAESLTKKMRTIAGVFMLGSAISLGASSAHANENSADSAEDISPYKVVEVSVDDGEGYIQGGVEYNLYDITNSETGKTVQIYATSLENAEEAAPEFAGPLPDWIKRILEKERDLQHSNVTEGGAFAPEKYSWEINGEEND